MTSKERVLRSLHFHNPDQTPRDIWVLPAAFCVHGDKLRLLASNDNLDFARVPFSDPTYDASIYKPGEFTDIWGCGWQNRQYGIIGEVKSWPLADNSSIDTYHSPAKIFRETGSSMYAQCSDFLRSYEDKFLLCGWLSVFERMQYLRGTANLFMDIAEESNEFYKIREIVWEYALEYVKAVCKIDFNAFIIGDDWGSQRAMLISPSAWRKLFKPVYKDIIDYILSMGKDVFFHSDGYILDLYDEWLSLGVAAVNTQINCMGINNVAEKVRNRLCLWGELDRQHVMPQGTAADVMDMVDSIKAAVESGGGLIGQFEVNKDMPWENVKAAYDRWVL